MVTKKNIFRILSFSLYFVAAFMVFLVLLFPFDQVKKRIEAEVGAKTPFELSIARISPRFANRVLLSDVVLSDKTGRVLFESPGIKVHLSLLGFLRGLRIVNLQGPAYGGEISLRSEEGSKRRSWSVDASNLDIGTYGLLKNLGFKLSGTVGGNFEMVNDVGKGRIWFKNLASRELKVKGFPVPDLDFEQGWIEAEVRGDRFMVRKLELDGKELKIRVSGDVVMRERGTMNLAIRLKPSERLSREQSGLLSFLKNRDAEGFYLFTLGGTVSEPFPRL
ncbi:MAG: type II secretion system protein GspN [Nitrospirota bacterium]|nr:type II secretion system protein GspN [Nitrospirota bacterium]